MLPVELILVRHGQSEGNVANRASRNRDNGFFTPEFRERHSRTFRLTDKGIEQAEAAGEWIRANIPQPLDRFYVSDYIRAKETAAHLHLPHALWRQEFHLRERDKALMDNVPDDEQKQLFQQEVKQYEIDPFFSYPAGGGESIAGLCLRVRAIMLGHWARDWSSARVVCVSHGHVMRAFQLELEGFSHDDFIRLDASEELAEKIRNCQILWYSRHDPDTHELTPHYVARRSVCPWDPQGDYGWTRIKRKKFTDEELLAEVGRYPRHVNPPANLYRAVRQLERLLGPRAGVGDECLDYQR
jgi:broad specificity phosphatase PhoE